MIAAPSKIPETSKLIIPAINIPGMMGVPLPSGFNGKTFEKSSTEKTTIIEELNKSFTSAINAVQNMRLYVLEQQKAR